MPHSHPYIYYMSVIQHIEQKVAVSQELRLGLQSIVQHKKLKRKTILLSPGMICNSQIYVVKGCLRSYYVTDQGQEHTIQFARDDWFISDFNSYITQMEATLYIEAISEVEIDLLPFKLTEELCKHHHQLEHFFRIVAQKAFAYAQKRVLSNLNDSAQERYEKFNQLYPDIVQAVPQYMLASYLGMTPEFLSKIRKKDGLFIS